MNVTLLPFTIIILYFANYRSNKYQHTKDEYSKLLKKIWHSRLLIFV